MLGYRGVSSRTCKGIYRSLLKAIRTSDSQSLFISGENLTCQAGLAVQPDLALVCLLGLSHVERNGHHYVDGMQGAPEAEMDSFAAAHADLYRRDRAGLHLRIEAGEIGTGALSASGALPDFGAMRPLS